MGVPLITPTNFAVCQADLLIKNDQSAKVFLGNSLIPHDPHSRDPGDQLPEAKYRFNRMLSSPPFGVTWGGKDGYELEARKLQTTRYSAGLPRVNDGALLFLQTMLAKMVAPADGGSRIAIVFNGSPLSNGDCGSGESEIRRWILENDWLDAIVMLPDQLFYNTATAAEYGRDYFEATGKKTTNLANTNATKVGQFPIPLPPLAEQEAICAHLGDKTAEVDRITATIQSQIATLTAYRKSLIHECVTGQRRVTEADAQAAV